MDSPRTKSYLEVLSNLNLSDKKTLLLVPEDNKNVYLSARNIPNAEVMKASDANTYNILHANNVILVASSIDKLKETLN